MKKVIILKEYDRIESDLESEGFNLSLKRYSDYRTVTLELEEARVDDMSKCIFDSLKSEYEMHHIYRYIKSHKLYFFKFQLEELSERVRVYLSGEKSRQLEQSAEERALKVLSEYIGKNAVVDLDGFIKFRLKFYRKEIIDSLEKSLSDLEMEDEYKDFIEVFRYFVDMQKPKQEEISIIFEEKGYKLMDKDKNPIDEEHIRRLGKDIYKEELNCEEILMSTLITTAPEKIHIYRDAEISEDIVGIIEEIFKGKVKTYDKFKALPI